MDKNNIQDWLIKRVAELVEVPFQEVDIHAPLSNYGLASIDAVSISGELGRLLSKDLPPTIAYDYPTIELLAGYLSEQTQPDRNVNQTKSTSYEKVANDIAVIGLACRFPRANNPDEFWKLLKHGEDAITEVPATRWSKKAYYHPDPATPGKSLSYWGGFLDQIELFDPNFFGVSPMEAEHMDPQQRLLLELSYEALEDAGQVKSQIAGSSTGIFIGISMNEYSLRQFQDPYGIKSHSGTGCALSVAANRLSYFHDFKGPSLAIDTACSSSLASIHLACKSLKSGESEMALAGGVNMILSPAHSIAFTKAGVLASDGRCKTFDANANGYVRGEGGGLLVLKRFTDAMQDNDRIYALIKGSKINQDGRSNGIMAPNQQSQVSMLTETLQETGFSPDQINYVETHGTGTLLGDEIETRALGEVLGKRSKNPCLIGSVKSNIGHLEAAAGIAGTIKIILSIKHREIPPSIHFKVPNPHINFDKLNLAVVNKMTPWPGGSVCVAGVSSFGFGGTNVHAILSSPPEDETDRNQKETKDGNCVLTLSAHTPNALEDIAKQFMEVLDPSHDHSLSDICYTRSVRRNHLDYRMAFVSDSKTAMRENLQSFLQDKDDSIREVKDSLKIVFVFSGQGGQWPGMGRELYQLYPVFKNYLDQCHSIIADQFGWSLLDTILASNNDSRLNEIAYVQPCIFSLQIAQIKLLRSFGIEADAVVGHSMGEVAAAYLAGGLSLKDALTVICSRSKLMKKSAGKGLMLVTEISDTDAEKWSRKFSVEVSAINSPGTTVFAGDPKAVNKLMEKLESENSFCQLVNVDIAAHTSQMDSYKSDLSKCLSGLEPKSTKLPFYSTVTGQRESNLVLSADYWSDNLRKPVLFKNSIEALAKDGYNTFIEVGPHPILLGSAQQTLDQNKSEKLLLPTMNRHENPQLTFLTSLAKLYSNGYTINWSSLYEDPCKVISLPTYPWQRQRYWLESIVSQSSYTLNASSSKGHAHPLLGQRISVASYPKLFVWKNQIDLRSQTFLEDHRAGNEIIFPASAYIEMALRTAKESGLNLYIITQIDFHHPMALTHDRPTIVQTELQTSHAPFTISIYSLSNNTDQWVEHFSAHFEKRINHQLTKVDHSAFETWEHINVGDEFYKKLAERGLHYGQSFQAIESVQINEDQALGEIQLPEHLEYNFSEYQVHPVMLDAGFQVISMLGDESDKALYMPRSCSSIIFFETQGQIQWSHVKLDSLQYEEEAVTVDVTLLSETFEPVLEIDQLKLQRIKGQAIPDSINHDLWLYKTKWEESENRPTSEVDLTRNWLIISDESDYGTLLAEGIKQTGGSVYQINWPEKVSQLSEVSDASFAELIEAILCELPYEADHILHLSSLSISSQQSVDSIYDLGCNSVLYLIKGIEKKFNTHPKLWLITEGAQPVLPDEKVRFDQSSIWGLGKVIGFELPELQCTCVDLDAAMGMEESVTSLLKLLAYTDTEDQVAIRDGKQFIHRIIPYSLNQAAYFNKKKIDPNGTYVISGGLGALGLVTCNLLIKSGAKNLVLLGRKPPTEEQTKELENLNQEGRKIETFSVDIAIRDEVNAAFEWVRKNLPPVKGIFHAAGILDDGALVNLDLTRMKGVMKTKLEGTLNLHEVSLELLLDHFVIYSSLVSILGSPGQGNYAAASAFVDSFVHYRRHLGLPALGINWGPWADVGLAAEASSRLEEQNASNQHLVKVIELNQGMEILETLLRDPSPQVSVVPFDLADLLELYPDAAEVPFFRGVLNNKASYSKHYRRPHLKQEYVAPQNNLEKKLADLWQKTLHIDKVGTHDSFFELGGDSVLAAQIISSVQKTFGIRVDLKEAFKAFTIQKLALIIEASLIEKVNSMSESEVENYLKNE